MFQRNIQYSGSATVLTDIICFGDGFGRPLVSDSRHPCGPWVAYEGGSILRTFSALFAIHVLPQETQMGYSGVQSLVPREIIS